MNALSRQLREGTLTGDCPNIITIITIARVFDVTNGSLGVCVYVVIDVNTSSKVKAWLCAKNTFWVKKKWPSMGASYTEQVAPHKHRRHYPVRHSKCRLVQTVQMKTGRKYYLPSWSAYVRNTWVNGEIITQPIQTVKRTLPHCFCIRLLSTIAVIIGTSPKRTLKFLAFRRSIFLYSWVLWTRSSYFLIFHPFERNDAKTTVVSV